MVKKKQGIIVLGVKRLDELINLFIRSSGVTNVLSTEMQLKFMNLHEAN